MSTAEAALLARAQRAYERGRALAGLRSATLVLPMAALSWVACRHPAATAFGALALAALLAHAVWRGQQAARGAWLGLAAGQAPLLLPILAELGGHACDASVCLFFPTACLLGGLAGGVALGIVAPRAGLGRHGVATAGLVAWLTGGLGCLVAGSLGVAVLVAALLAGLGPTLALRRA
jgi:hypothetical protein